MAAPQPFDYTDRKALCRIVLRVTIYVLLVSVLLVIQVESKTLFHPLGELCSLPRSDRKPFFHPVGELCSLFRSTRKLFFT